MWMWPHVFLGHSQQVLRTRVSCHCGLCFTSSGSLTAGPQEAKGSCQPGHGPMAPRKLTAGPEGAVGSCQHRRSPICPEAKVLILKRLETPVSLDSAPTFFLRLTTGPDKDGVFCLHGSIPIFPEVYTGGPEDVSVLLCGHGPRPPIASLQILRRPGLLDTFQKTQIMS